MSEQMNFKRIPDAWFLGSILIYTLFFLGIFIVGQKFDRIFQELLEGDIPAITRIMLNKATVIFLYFSFLSAIIANRFLVCSGKIRTINSGILLLISFVFLLFYVYCLFTPLIITIDKIGDENRSHNKQVESTSNPTDTPH